MALTKVDTDLDFSGVSKLIRALLNPVASDPGSPSVGEAWFNTTDVRLKYFDGATQTIANLNDVTGGAITGALWDAQSYIKAVLNDTPVVQVVGTNELVGRGTGDLGVVTFAALLTALEGLGITADTLGSSSEAAVLARANHTGTQLSSTISDFNTAADARAQAIVDATIDAAPEVLDTLNELAAAIGDDPNFATTITNLIAAKTGKFAANIGNGALQTFTVTHSLGTTDVGVFVKINATGEVVDCYWDTPDANNVEIQTNSVPAANAYRVVVIG